MHYTKIHTLFLLFLFATSSLPGQSQPTEDFQLLYQQICDTVARHFYDQSVISTKFEAIRKQYEKDLEQLPDRYAFGKRINEMLAELQTSHTHWYQPGEPEYYQLADIFSAVPSIHALFATDTIRYLSLGIYLKEIEEKLFVAGILAGGPAEKAGLMVGDQIVKINGASHFLPNLLDLEAEKEILVHYQRNANDAALRECTVMPEWINPRTEFLRAQEGSIRIIEKEGKKIGYIHIWSYAGQAYHDAFVDAIAWGPLMEADALIWDLRDGWGGRLTRLSECIQPKYPHYLDDHCGW